MRTRGLIVLGVLSAALALPPAAQAQFSPQGIIGAATAPLRYMLGPLGHLPYVRRHRAVPEAHSRAPAAAAVTRLSRLGPPAWPEAYEDLIGYVFWPGEYQPVRDRGFDVIADTITGSFPAEAAAPRVATTTGAADDIDVCGATDATNDWPKSRLEQAPQLSGPEQEALASLQSAVVQSTKNAASDCRNPPSASPSDRLAALVQALWAVRDAGLFMRGPLRAFTESLTPARRAAFAGPADDGAKSDGEKSDAAKAADNAAQACAAQNVGEAEQMVRLIEQRTRPDKEQAARLESLHKASTNMAKLLIRGCAQPAPATPQARLDAAADQLTTLNYAATAVQIAFDVFYTRLDDRQKARLAKAGR
jgi:hypothetical protein